MSGHFEAKKIAWRQTKDGLVLALAVHPDEMPKDLALAPLNTRYMIGYAEIGDDEHPVAQPDQSISPAADEAGSSPAGVTSQVSEANGSPKKSWSEYSRSQQAAILCADPDFREYFGSHDTSSCDGKLKYHFRIGRKRDLDKPENHARWDEFVAIWQMRRQK